MSVEQGLLKATVLKCLNGSKDKNSREIFDHITTVPYSYHSSTVNYDDILYSGTIEALRVELVYLRKHGFIKKTRKTRLLTYALTTLGNRDVEAPFKFAEVFDGRVQAEVDKRMKVIQITEQPPIDKFIERNSILNLGSSNEVGINVSDDPTKRKFAVLKVINGVPSLDI